MQAKPGAHWRIPASNPAVRQKAGSFMSTLANTTVVSTRFDREDGALGPKKLALLVAALVVVGAIAIYAGQQYVEGIDTWPATVTGVAKNTANFTFDESVGEIEVANYPAGMVLEEGDTVLVRIDEDKGNFIVKVEE
jgi:hypothetical protein